MQIWRFGFGRSVSGSVYSEGTYLSKDDEKTYWGRIEFVQGDNEEGASKENEGEVSSIDATVPTMTTSDDAAPRLIVKGSVILGGNGLEPQPIGRFILTERTTVENDDEEEDDDDDDDTPRTTLLDATDSDDPPYFNADDAFQ